MVGRKSVNRPASRMLTAAGLAMTFTIGSTSVGSAASLPSGDHRDRRLSVDDLAPYQPQRTCNPSAKPGVAAFRARVLRAYPSTYDSGITRACHIGGTSEHKEGRAWDWGVRDKDVAKDFLKSLLARDGDRRSKYAGTRRYGIMYIIYDGRIWRSYDAKGWKCYPCSGTTQCHEDHVHFSFSWEGAHKRTSGWDGTPVRYDES